MCRRASSAQILIAALGIILAVGGCDEKQPGAPFQAEADGDAGGARARAAAGSPSPDGTSGEPDMSRAEAGSPEGPREPEGAAQRGDGRPSPALSADERAVQEMLDRVGGRQQRLPGTPIGPGAYGGRIELPGTSATHSDLEVLRHLQSLYSITISGPGFGDASIPLLLHLPKLATIHLIGPTFTDQGIARLAAHKALRILILEKVALGKEGIVGLARSDSLEYLDLVNMTITSQVMAELPLLRHLREIRFIGSDVPASDVARLRAQLPECDIVVKPDNT